MFFNLQATNLNICQLVNLSLFRMTLTRAIAETTIAYLIELEAMDTSDPTVEMLLVSYKSIQSRLKRLL